MFALSARLWFDIIEERLVKQIFRKEFRER